MPINIKHDNITNKIHKNPVEVDFTIKRCLIDQKTNEVSTKGAKKFLKSKKI